MKKYTRTPPVSPAQARAKTLTARFMARQIVPVAAPTTNERPQYPIPKEGEMLVVLLPAVGAARIAVIERGLESLQTQVSGLIEQFPTRVKGTIGVCNDEFTFRPYPLNRNASLLRAPGVAFIFGDVVICGDGNYCFDSVPVALFEAIEARLGVKLECEIEGPCPCGRMLETDCAGECEFPPMEEKSC